MYLGRIRYNFLDAKLRAAFLKGEWSQRDYYEVTQAIEAMTEF